jgi:hypothetical protein
VLAAVEEFLGALSGAGAAAAGPAGAAAER